MGWLLHEKSPFFSPREQVASLRLRASQDTNPCPRDCREGFLMEWIMARNLLRSLVAVSLFAAGCASEATSDRGDETGASESAVRTATCPADVSVSVSDLAMRT